MSQKNFKGHNKLSMAITHKSRPGARHWWLLPIILATQEAEIRRIVRPYLEKNLSQKRACGVAQVVEHLPSKNEALSLNPIATKK
jgi:hypothetical protein